MRLLFAGWAVSGCLSFDINLEELLILSLLELKEALILGQKCSQRGLYDMMF